MLTLIRTFLGFLFVAVSLPASAASVPTEPALPGDKVVISFFEYPPLAHVSHTGRVSGTVIETVREICAKAQIDCELRMLPVARVYRSISNGTASVIITGRHPSLGNCCSDANWHFPWTAGIYSKTPVDLIADSEEELRYRKMIIIRGWLSPYRYFENLRTLSDQGVVKLAMAQDNSSAIRMLEHERAEYLWGGSHFSWYLEKRGLTGEFNYKPLISSPLALWVDKNRPDVLLALNKGYQRLKQEGGLTADGSQLNRFLMSERYEDAASY